MVLSPVDPFTLLRSRFGDQALPGGSFYFEQINGQWHSPGQTGCKNPPQGLLPASPDRAGSLLETTGPWCHNCAEGILREGARHTALYRAARIVAHLLSLMDADVEDHEYLLQYQRVQRAAVEFTAMPAPFHRAFPGLLLDVEFFLASMEAEIVSPAGQRYQDLLVEKVVDQVGLGMDNLDTTPTLLHLQVVTDPFLRNLDATTGVLAALEMRAVATSRDESTTSPWLLVVAPRYMADFLLVSRGPFVLRQHYPAPSDSEVLETVAGLLELVPPASAPVGGVSHALRQTILAAEHLHGK